MHTAFDIPRGRSDWVMILWLSLGALFALPPWSAAQLATASEKVYIKDVEVQGNQKTRTAIILRELTFQPGDSILLEELPDKLRRSEQLVMNTGLFNAVDITYQQWKGATREVSLEVAVKETWYLYPIPVLELADRNFNVWWVEYGHSLNRLNYGIDFTHLNTTGQRDKLQFAVKYGFTRHYSLAYEIPYINDEQTIGLFWDVAYNRNKEVNYLTLDNKQEFFRNDDRFIYQRFRAQTGLVIRPGLRTRHQLVGAYRQNRINDEIAGELNPGFFLNGRQLQRYFSLAYLYTYDNRDIRPYPLDGDFFHFTLQKHGLGLFDDRNALEMTARYDRYFRFRPRWSFGLMTKGKVSLIREAQPYNANRAMGFSTVNTLRGFEYYVMDGLDMVLMKTSLRYLLWEKSFDFGRIMPIPQFRRLPVKVFLTLNNDTGYVNGPYARQNNPLTNSWLWGGGLGIDFIFYYDKVVRIEYSFNHLLENGLFLHLELNI